MRKQYWRGAKRKERRRCKVASAILPANEITGRVVARNGMKIRTETEKREREKLNSVSLVHLPSLFIRFPFPTPPSLSLCQPRLFVLSEQREREKERRKEKADPCLRAECD